MSEGGDPFAPPLDTLRRRTGRKWSKHGPDMLPAWIADMDFLPAPSIRAAVADALETGDFGYGPAADVSGVPEAFAGWARRRWNWALDPQHVRVMPDVVGGLANAIEALTAPGDGVVVQTPAYPPLMSSVRVAGRRLIEVPLGDKGLGLDALEAALRVERPALMILCHPHNPTGRVFSEAELQRLGELAFEHGVIVVSDEVHADLTLDGRQHIPFASLSPDHAAITVTLNAASKAFNVAGLRCAVCVAEGEPHARLSKLPPTRWNAFSTLGVRAARAAWSDAGEAWLAACVTHLERMRDRLAARLPEVCPGARMVAPQAGYLAWLDFREAGFDREPATAFLDEADVALSPGLDFGPEGRGFARLNFATSETILDAILERMGAVSSAATARGRT